MMKRYLGDGVYAEFDGYVIILRTGSHIQDEADNEIILDNDVTNALLAFIRDIGAIDEK
jgi:hypothetical protein